MSRRSLTLLLLLAALLAGAGGCGIPGETGVRIDGRGPLPGNNSSDGGGRTTPPRREAASTVEDFVRNFLQAPAGEVTDVYERVNAYIAPGARLRPAGDETAVNVVREIDLTNEQKIPGVSWEVTLSVQHVGVLRADGTLSPPTAGDRGKYTLTVGRIEGSRGFHVLKPPSLLLMSVDALDDYYQRRMIYFWSSSRSALVPDLRYLPGVVPPPRRATEVLGWLVGGPAPWLVPAAVRLPEGTKAIGNVPDPRPNGRLEVNLSVPADAVDDETRLEQLFIQLAWSLPDPTSSPLDRLRELELKIQGQSRKIAEIETYRRSHPLYQVEGDPGRFGVQQGKVRSLEPGQDGVPITSELNQDVVTAALNRDGTGAWVALVTGEGDGRRRLRTGAGPVPVRELWLSKRSFRSLSQPAWLKSADRAQPAGLVVADGKLMRFGVNADLTEVSVPNLPAGKPLVTVAVALDGHRIALVVEDGGLYVAAVTVEPDSVTVGPARPVPTSLTDLTAVTWSGEEWLLVSGRKGEGPATIYRTRVDGGGERKEIRGDVPEPVVQLAAYPDNPVRRARTGMLYGTRTGIYSDQGELITLEAEPSEQAFTAPFFYY